MPISIYIPIFNLNNIIWILIFYDFITWSILCFVQSELLNCLKFLLPFENMQIDFLPEHALPVNKSDIRVYDLCSPMSL